jgi:glucose 1-dehydrogenase
MQLERKVAIVTGSATGIGEAIATRMAQEGAAVAIDYIAGQQDKAAQVVSRIEQAGGKAIALEADVSKEDQITQLIARTVETFGKLDIMVNNAGVEREHPFLEMPLDVWNWVIAVNLTGPWLCSQAAARQMVSQGNGGRIINISSVHEDLPMPTNAP